MATDKKPSSVDNLALEIKKVIENLGEFRNKFDDEKTNIISSINETFSSFNSKLKQHTVTFQKTKEEILSNFGSKKKDLINAVTLLQENWKKSFSFFMQKITSIVVFAGILFVYCLFVLFGVIQYLLGYVAKAFPDLLIVRDILTVIAALIPFLLMGWIVYSYYKIRRRKQEDFEGLDTIKHELQNEDLMLPSLPEGPAPSYVEEKHAQLGNLWKTLQAEFEASIPIIKQQYAASKFLAKWESKSDEFLSFSKYFKLDLENSVEEIRSSLLKEARKSNDEKLWETMIINSLSKDTSLSANVLNLFFSKYKGIPTGQFWKNIKQNKGELLQTAKIVYASWHIDIKKDLVTVENLACLLGKLPTFDFSELSRRLANLISLWDYLSNYQNFLGEQRVNLQNKMELDDLINLINIDNSFEENLFSILATLKIKDVPEDLQSTYSGVFIAVYLNKDLRFRESAFKRCANENSALLLSVYLDLQEKAMHEKGDFRLLDLVNSQSLIVGKKTEIEQNQEGELDKFNYFKSALSEGKWYDSPAILMRDFIERKTSAIRADIKKIANFEKIKKFLKETFQNVNINVIEKAIDAQLFTGYVILTESEEGNLTTAIDELSGRWTKGNNIFMKRTQVQLDEIKNKYGVDLGTVEKPKYDFVKYTAGTRIGVLDRDKDFNSFVKEFKSDLREVLKKNSSSHYDIGVVIYRISPSKYSFGILDREDIKNLTNVKQKDIKMASYLASLAEDHISEAERSTLLTFDSSINLFKIFEKLSFSKVLFPDVTLGRKDKKFLDSDKFRKEILAVLKKQNINTFKELSNAINKGTISKDAFIKAFEKVFQMSQEIEGESYSLPTLKKEQALNSFFNVLLALAEFEAEILK